jgi:hypothetical protein
MTFTDDGTTEGAAATAASPPTSNTPVPTATDIDQGVGMTGLFKGIDSKGRPLVVGGEAPCDPAMRGGSGRRAVVGYPAADGNRADRRAYQKASPGRLAAGPPPMSKSTRCRTHF